VPDLADGGAPTIRRLGRGQLEQIPSGLARYHATRHAIGATTYEVGDGTATGDVTGTAHHLRADGGPAGPGVDVIWYLRYVDDYVPVDDGWLIACRVLHLRRIEERRVTHLGPGR